MKKKFVSPTIKSYRYAVVTQLGGSGDAPAIHDINGITRVFGTPWCGSSGEAINRFLHDIYSTINI